MRLLFVHQNFPGQYRHIAPHLAATPGWEVSAIGEKSNVLRQKDLKLPGVRRLAYQGQALPEQAIQPFTASLQRAIHLGRVVARGMEKLKQSGYTPDLICAHIGWGEGIFLKDVWPEAKVLLYSEFFYNAKGSDVGFDPEFPTNPEKIHRLRVLNAPLLMSLQGSDWGIAPTRWQHQQFPEEYKGRISIAHDGIDTTWIKPDPNAVFTLPDGGGSFSRQDEVITYVSRNLEPYRGFHIFMRAIPELQRRRPKARIVIVGADEVSYSPRPPKGQTYRSRLLAEMKDKIDLSRIHWMPWLPHPEFIRLLQISSAHVYLTYPFIASWSLQEAMAAGCVCIASDVTPVREYIDNGKTGLLVDFFSPQAIAETVDQALREGDALEPMRRAARQSVIDRYDLKSICLPALTRLHEQVARGEKPANGRDAVLAG